MGVRHLKDLRAYLEKNADKAFSRTELRDELKQNYPTILDNLDYLIEQDAVVEQLPGDPNKFQWKRGNDTNGKLSAEEGEDTHSDS